MLVLDNFDIKVIDFFKKDDEVELRETNYQDAVTMFLAPEARDQDDSMKSQVYSLGCLLYLMIQLKQAGPAPNEISPFTCKFDFTDCKKIVDKKSKFLIVNQMMSQDPEERPSFDQIREAMEEIRELPQEERLPLVIPPLDHSYYEKDYV